MSLTYLINECKKRFLNRVNFFEVNQISWTFIIDFFWKGGRSFYLNSFFLHSLTAEQIYDFYCQYTAQYKATFLYVYSYGHFALVLYNINYVYSVTFNRQSYQNLSFNKVKDQLCTYGGGCGGREDHILQSSNILKQVQYVWSSIYLLGQEGEKDRDGLKLAILAVSLLNPLYHCTEP